MRLSEIEFGVVAGQHSLEQLAHGACHLHPGRPAAHDDKVQDTLVDQLGMGAGTFELAQDVAADVGGFREALEVEGVLADAGGAEVVVDGARTDDEEVEGELVIAPKLHHPVAPVHADHDPLAEADVPLPVEDVAHLMRDVVDGEAGGGHLVEQRLEGVVVVLVDDKHIDGGVLERLGGV